MKRSDVQVNGSDFGHQKAWFQAPRKRRRLGVGSAGESEPEAPAGRGQGAGESEPGAPASRSGGRAGGAGPRARGGAEPGAPAVKQIGSHGVLALVFPGQGSQRPGMGEPWREHPSWKVVEAVSEAVGRDAGELLTTADAETLRQTRNSQLAAFTLSVLIADAAGFPAGAAANAGAGGSAHGGGASGEAGAGEGSGHSDEQAGGEGSGHSSGQAGAGAGGAGKRPAVAGVAGHSLGEYTALVVAGALDLADGARLVAARGNAMQEAADAKPGTMAAVLGLDPEGVAKACAAVEGAWVANDNAPGQIVIAGTAEGIDKASESAKELGAKRVMPLPVGGAFHSPLMAAAQKPLDSALSAAPWPSKPIAVPVVANVDAAPHTKGFQSVLSSQLCSQVRWRESLTTLSGLGADHYLELGPGTELSGMVKRTVEGAARANVAKPDDLSKLEDFL